MFVTVLLSIVVNLIQEYVKTLTVLDRSLISVLVNPVWLRMYVQKLLSYTPQQFLKVKFIHKDHSCDQAVLYSCTVL